MGGQHPTSNAQRPTSNGPFDLEERLLGFAARIIRVVDVLFSTRAGNHVGGQVLRSGTSPLPNHGEAQAAESVQDFIHKLKISLKELYETRRWLRLIQRVPLMDKPARLDLLIDENEQWIRIFYRSIQTARRRRDEDQQSARVREDEPEPWILSPWENGVETWVLSGEPTAYPKPQEGDHL